MVLFTPCSQHGDVPAPRVGHAHCQSGPFLWIFGGWSSDAIGLRNDLFEMNTSDGRWRRLHPHCWSQRNGQMTMDPSDFPVSRGVRLSEAWGQLPCPRSHGGMVYLENMNALLLFGGYASNVDCLNDTFVYLFRTGRWVRVVHDDIPMSLGGSVAAASLSSGHAGLLPRLSRSNTKNVLQQMTVGDATVPSPRAAFSIIYTNAHVLLFGGFVKSTSGASDELWLLDCHSGRPSEFRWRLISEDEIGWNVETVSLPLQEMLSTTTVAGASSNSLLSKQTFSQNQTYSTKSLAIADRMMVSLCGHAMCHVPAKRDLVQEMAVKRRSRTNSMDSDDSDGGGDDMRIDRETYYLYGGLSDEGGMNRHVYRLSIDWIVRSSGKPVVKTLCWTRLDHEFNVPVHTSAVALLDHMFPSGRTGHSLVTYAGHYLVLFGGLQSRDAWLFDIRSVRWFRLHEDDGDWIPDALEGCSTCIDGSARRLLVWGGRSLHGCQNASFTVDCTLRKGRVFSKLRAAIRLMQDGKRFGASKKTSFDASSLPASTSRSAGDTLEEPIAEGVTVLSDGASSARFTDVDSEDADYGEEEDKGSSFFLTESRIGRSPGVRGKGKKLKTSPNGQQRTLKTTVGTGNALVRRGSSRMSIRVDSPVLVGRWMALSPDAHAEARVHRLTNESVNDDDDEQWRNSVQAQRTKILEHMRQDSIARLELLEVVPHRFAKQVQSRMDETEAVEDKIYSTVKERFYRSRSSNVRRAMSPDADKTDPSLAAASGSPSGSEPRVRDKPAAYAFSEYELQLVRDALTLGEHVQKNAATDVAELVEEIEHMVAENERLGDAVRFQTEVLHPYESLGVLVKKDIPVHSQSLVQEKRDRKARDKQRQREAIEDLHRRRAATHLGFHHETGNHDVDDEDVLFARERVPLSQKKSKVSLPKVATSPYNRFKSPPPLNDLRNEYTPAQAAAVAEEFSPVPGQLVFMPTPRRRQVPPPEVVQVLFNSSSPVQERDKDAQEVPPPAAWNKRKRIIEHQWDRMVRMSPKVNRLRPLATLNVGPEVSVEGQSARLQH